MSTLYLTNTLKVDFYSVNSLKQQFKDGHLDTFWFRDNQSSAVLPNVGLARPTIYSTWECKQSHHDALFWYLKRIGT
jgi:hypothetical protein